MTNTFSSAAPSRTLECASNWCVGRGLDDTENMQAGLNAAAGGSFYIDRPPVIVTTTGTGSANSTSLSVASYTAIIDGMAVLDTANPVAIPAGTIVTSNPGSGTLTLSQALTTAISGDTLIFTGPPWRVRGGLQIPPNTRVYGDGGTGLYPVSDSATASHLIPDIQLIAGALCVNLQ
jgi:hypothetical protein